MFVCLFGVLPFFFLTFPRVCSPLGQGRSWEQEVAAFISSAARKPRVLSAYAQLALTPSQTEILAHGMAPPKFRIVLFNSVKLI